MRKILLSFTFVFLLLAQQGLAQWNTNTAQNTAICSTPPTQVTRSQIETVSDGNNGMFICWSDGGTSVKLQRVSISSKAIFQENGVNVTTVTSGNIGNLAMTSDGSGGVIITWTNNNDIFGQRVNASGQLLWTGDKPMNKLTAGTQSGMVLTVVNANHAIAAFVDSRNTASGNDVYMQKVDIANGNLLLDIDTPACKAVNGQTSLQIVADGSGGAYIAWEDPRAATTNRDIYAIRVNNDCLPVSGWQTDGNPVCTAALNQTGPTMISDNNNGVYITWTDFRQAATNGDIYAQRMAANGSPIWAANGVSVNKNIGSQTNPQVIAVNDGAIFAWTDPRISTTNRDIYAQKISLATGDTLWTAEGVKICDAAGNQPSSTSDGLAMVTDGSNGAIILWADARVSSTNREIYAQRVNSSGVVQWTANGLLISDAPDNQGSSIGMEYIPANKGIIAVWQDSRSGTANGEIYGALVSGDGNLTSSIARLPQLEGKIKAFPVPAQQEISISMQGVKPGNYLLQITDVSGRILLTEKLGINGNMGMIRTNLQNLNAGSYYLMLQHEASKATTLIPFIKQ